LEQTLSSGAPAYQTTLSPESRSLLIDVSSSYVLLRKVFVTGFVNRQEQSILGQSYGLTQYGVNANYNFGKRFKGLTVTLGVIDSANEAGNLGAGLQSNVYYSHTFGRWDFSADFAYNQSTQTLLAIYTTSSMTYFANARRQFAKGLGWNIGAGGGHSGFNQQAGNSSDAESVNSNLNWHGYSAGGNYSQSSGTSVLTANGLVSEPAPIISASNLVVFNGKGWGVGAGASPLRALVISVSYSKATSNTLSQNLPSTNSTELMNGYATYHFRRVFFTSGVTRFRQGISGSGSAPSLTTSYYFGVSRWFKFF
jgi:hypothetical protein